MANFVTDNTPLPVYVDGTPPQGLPGEFDAVDVNTIWGALGDVRTELGLVPSVTTITGPGTKNLARGSAANSVAADVGGSTIAGGGSTSQPQIIGSVAASNASVATIGGGYDNTNNMLAGTIAGGAHHVLAYSSGGNHGFIGGGSLHTIDATGPYNGIGAGTGNKITGASQRSWIGGGQTNTINTATGGASIGGGANNSASGDSSFIGGGSANLNDVNATAATIGGGSQNQITGVGATYGTIAGGTQGHITAAAYGSIGGGVTNTVSANFGHVGGGQSNVVSGQYAVVAGGGTNAASGTRAAVLGGANNTASAESATVLNGQQNTASGAYSTVRGLRGTASQYGQHTIASGFFAVAGDAQGFDLLLRAITTDATLTTLTLDGAGSQLGIDDNSTWAFSILLVARRTDAADHAAYQLQGLIKRDVGAATTAIIGAVTVTTLAESDATWNATAVANTANGRLSVQVTGAAGKTIRWVAHLRASSVSQ